ncbi:hypothetical protein GGQ84_000629 [Desulfitispora alkaliphila]|uniref:chitin disaccharide deacetylase n=1 Tax=Desulfitispora alkaliphila TaxID=622674 RepID=UPI003D1D4BEA
MTIKLIVNADDLGYSEGVNRGILKAQQRGIVTSTTVLVNRNATAEALKLASSSQLPAVGVHLCLSSGKALSQSNNIPKLVDEQGYFFSKDRVLQEPFPLDQVKRELRQQIETVLRMGVELTHLDSHHHVHMNPVILEAVADLAVEYKLPVRSVSQSMRAYLSERKVRTCGAFIGDFFGEGATSTNLIELLDQAKSLETGRVVELMTHPGEVDSLLLKWSSYKGEREKELQVLTKEGLTQIIESMGFVLTDYRNAFK